MDVIDLSNVRITWDGCATHGEAAKAGSHIFLWEFGKYRKVSALVTSVIRTEVRDKIILVIKHEKTWKIAFSLCGVTWPRGEEPYADDAFELLRQTVLHRSVEVLMDTLDEDGYFIGTLLASNTHVAIPLLEVGLAKMEELYLKDYSTEFNKAQKSARSKKLKAHPPPPRLFATLPSYERHQLPPHPSVAAAYLPLSLFPLSLFPLSAFEQTHLISANSTAISLAKNGARVTQRECHTQHHSKTQTQ
ncbi:hypothetical protein ACE6H2_024997 [Prunus campanulata]